MQYLTKYSLQMTFNQKPFFSELRWIGGDAWLQLLQIAMICFHQLLFVNE